METVSVHSSRPYEVLIGDGLLPRAGELARAVTNAKRAVVVSDETVFPLYGKTVCASLEAAGFETVFFLLPAGEREKTLSRCEALWSFLSECGVDRGDVLFSLGGGVVGDLTGFAASVYRRGIDCIQLPTTLLAAVDASVGGKTAVDLPQGKNLLGSFYPPRLVLTDCTVLRALPDTVFRDGCAEVIKMAILGNAPLFSRLEDGLSDGLEAVVADCVRDKRDIVERDEFDRGERMKLNLGHTFGHAVELCSGYTIPHGQAVSMGLAAVSRAALKRGLLPAEDGKRILSLLSRYGLPTELPFPVAALYEAALGDKKMLGGTARLIVPHGIGRCEITELSQEELLSWLRDGGAK